MQATQRRLNILAFALILAFASSCARHGVIKTEQSTSVARAVLIGDLAPVREGRLNELRLADVSNGVIDWGIGHGSIGGTDSTLRDIMFVGGRPVGPTGATPADGRFVGPFAAGIAPNQFPAARYRSAASMKSAPLDDFLIDLASTYDEPILVAGRVEFSRLRSGTGLNGEAAPQSFRNVETLFVAILARDEYALDERTGQIFHIPADMVGLVDDVSISSAAILPKVPRNWREIGPQLAERVTSVVSIDRMESWVSGGDIDIYLLDSVTTP